MEDRVDEGLIKGAKEIVPLEETLMHHMGNFICKINGNKIGTGFFCKIPYKGNLIPVLITNNHVIDDDYLKDKNYIKFYINEDSQIINIDKNSKIYSSNRNEYDITIIKLNEADEIKNFLEIDKNIFKNNSELYYKDEQIYILHYPNAGKPSISYGKGIEKLTDFDIKHFCNTQPGSSGGPILSLLTNKIIGIHKAFIKKGYNIGTFLKFPLNELNGTSINQSLNENININDSNEIRIIINISKDDINKDIYFLDNTDGIEDNKGIKHYHDNLKELNETNTELYINDKQIKYHKYYRFEKEGLYSVILRFNIFMKDCSFMFYGCKRILLIDLSKFVTKDINNMSNMFSLCYILQMIVDNPNWNTEKVNNMSNMFKLCFSLNYLPDLSKWNTKNVKDMSSIFYECSSLISFPNISEWNTINVNNLSCMFKSCSSLKSLPDISKWNIKNVKDMSEMFFGCYSLISLPDISKWKKDKSCKMENMFFGCDSLKSIPDISQNDEIAEDYIKKIKTNNTKENKDEIKEKENMIAESSVDDKDNREKELEGIDYEDDYNYFDSIYSNNTIIGKINEKEVDMKNVIPMQSKKNLILYKYLYSNYIRGRFGWKI